MYLSYFFSLFFSFRTHSNRFSQQDLTCLHPDLTDLTPLSQFQTSHDTLLNFESTPPPSRMRTYLPSHPFADFRNPKWTRPGTTIVSFSSFRHFVFQHLSSLSKHSKREREEERKERGDTVREIFQIVEVLIHFVRCPVPPFEKSVVVSQLLLGQYKSLMSNDPVS